MYLAPSTSFTAITPIGPFTWPHLRAAAEVWFSPGGPDTLRHPGEGRGSETVFD
jgi:hypothetical protein